VTLEPGAKVAAADVVVEHAPVAAEQVVEGAPTAGDSLLGDVGGVGVGVWEHTPGTSTDTEVDEVSVVIAGRARIDFIEPELPSIEIGPGDVFRLAAGMRTVWTVSETLRKVYVA
jgi:uncharacterized cupin superfamily protein